ncbi:MAG TPA: hypothetical protein VFJ74_02170, partial [Gemmatimonadaceae bacterium]|nr:hypothetical protein [Gemmatimonadaceae bacterium]
MTANVPPLTATLTPSPEDGSTAPITMGTYASDVIATMTVTGDMVVKPTVYGRDTARLTDTIYDPGGAFDYQWGSCKGSITVQAVDVRDLTFRFNPCNGPSQHTTVHQKIGRFRGAVTAGRGTAITSCVISQNPGSKCWDYARATPVTTVTVTPVSTTLSVTADRATVLAGDTVTFTLAVTPGNVEGFAIPFTVTSNQWVTDAGARTNACGIAGAGTCRKVITESGRL